MATPGNFIKTPGKLLEFKFLNLAGHPKTWFRIRLCNTMISTMNKCKRLGEQPTATAFDTSLQNALLIPKSK